MLRDKTIIKKVIVRKVTKIIPNIRLFRLRHCPTAPLDISAYRQKKGITKQAQISDLGLKEQAIAQVAGLLHKIHLQLIEVQNVQHQPRKQVNLVYRGYR